MKTVRELIADYLLEQFANCVTGSNGKSVQFQGVDEGRRYFGLYGTDGYWESETTDIEKALDYIGI